jgi:hypothetical protein
MARIDVRISVAEDTAYETPVTNQMSKQLSHLSGQALTLFWEIISKPPSRSGVPVILILSSLVLGHHLLQNHALFAINCILSARTTQRKHSPSIVA